MAANASAPTLAAPPVHGIRLPACALGIYLVLMATAHLSGQERFGELAAFALTGLFLLPALRRRRAWAWCAWLGVAALLAALDLHGQGRLALDATPVAINLALCGVFARTLRHGRAPLIARVIEALEGRSRLAEPRVAAYARALTWVWTLVFAAQAVVLAILVACAMPAGPLALLGLQPPLAMGGAGWRWYLHLGSYALVPALLVLEYAFRRCYLRHIPHPSLPTFLASLGRRWHTLAYSLADDAPRAGR